MFVVIMGGSEFRIFLHCHLGPACVLFLFSFVLRYFLIYFVSYFVVPLVLYIYVVYFLYTCEIFSCLSVIFV